MNTRNHHVCRADRRKCAEVRSRRGLRIPCRRNLRDCIACHPGFAGELLEVEEGAIVVVDDINGASAAPGLEVSMDLRSDRAQPKLGTGSPRAPVEGSVVVTLPAVKCPETGRLGEIDDAVEIRGSTADLADRRRRVIGVDRLAAGAYTDGCCRT